MPHFVQRTDRVCPPTLPTISKEGRPRGTEQAAPDAKNRTWKHWRSSTSSKHLFANVENKCRTSLDMDKDQVKNDTRVQCIGQMLILEELSWKCSRHPQQELRRLSGAADFLRSQRTLRPRGENGSRCLKLQESGQIGQHRRSLEERRAVS